MNKITLACIAGVAVTVILAGVCWFLLPDQVGMQFGLSGQLQNFMPKPVALLLPVGLSALGAGLSTREGRRNAGLILSLISPVLLVVTLILN